MAVGPSLGVLSTDMHIAVPLDNIERIVKEFHSRLSTSHWRDSYFVSMGIASLIGMYCISR